MPKENNLISSKTFIQKRHLKQDNDNCIYYNQNAKYEAKIPSGLY